MCVVKTNVLISCAVTAQLICTFVSACADCWFSYAATHIFVFPGVCDTYLPQSDIKTSTFVKQWILTVYVYIC